MELKLSGKIIKGIGGLYEVKLHPEDAQKISEWTTENAGTDRLFCRAKGAFRHGRITPLAGDNVAVRVDTELLVSEANEAQRSGQAAAGAYIEAIDERQNDLIRPPLANLDVIYIVFSCVEPEPSLTIVDKLTTIADFKGIEPVILVTKADLAPDRAEHYRQLYDKCGFTAFVEGVGYDVTGLAAFIRARADQTSAFAGTSGVGKSTLMNRLFPSLGLATGEVSPKTGHGRHTTRHTELFPLAGSFGTDTDPGAAGYLADTPGFGMLDFVKFDFYTKEDLPGVFREFAPFLGNCRYTKCTHTKEEGCAILEAVEDGRIPRERHTSYLELYEALKNKHSWKN